MLSLLFVAALSGPADAQEIIDFGTAGTVTTSDSDRYTIQPGDTLWDISTAFMGDPYYWPRLWSFNDYITNPHWIYPGQAVVFKPGTVLDPPEMDLPEVRQAGYTPPDTVLIDSQLECGPDVRYDESYPSAHYQVPAFLADPADVEVWGSVYAAKSGHVSLAEGELIYLDLDDTDAVGCGDVVSIIRQGEKVRHPETRKVSYGNLFHVIADARILHIDEDDQVTAVVRRMYGPVKRGDVVGPIITVDAELPSQPPRGDLAGVVIARSGQALYDLAGPGEVVFIDRGRADGLRVGNSMYVIHQRDQSVSLLVDQDNIPEQVVARVIVTGVEENHSTGVIIRAATHVSVGDRVSQTVQ
ncbi:MAG TPA: LysM peptidoglycan-binding domain-containing protein [Myxococcota bacterium]|nr:LysM peptidoglycan-binding domain-containing protein [Myxococcota bacterium]